MSTPSEGAALDVAFRLVDGLIGVTGSAVAAVDRHGTVRRWNAGAERLIGLTEATACGASFVEVAVPADRRTEAAGWLRAALRGAGGTRMASFRTRAAGVATALVSIVPVPGPVGVPAGALVVAGLAGLGPEQATQASLLETIVGQSPLGVAVFDDRGRYVRVNPALERMLGLGAAQMLGQPVDQVAPALLGRLVAPEVRAVIATGVPVLGAEVQGTTAGAADQVGAARAARERSLVASCFRLAALDGTVLGAALVVSDVSESHRTRSELERGNARLELLGRAAAVLSASLDLEHTLAGLGRLVVPDFADHCIVDLVEDSQDPEHGRPVAGALRRYALVHAEGLRAEGRWTPVGDSVVYPPGHPVHTVLTTGEMLHVQVDPDDFDYAAVAPTAGSAAFARAVGVRAALTLPLRARGAVVGVVSFAASASGRSYQDDDVLLARQLADRAAVAIDNARLYGRELRHALTLQRSLLPERLPAAPGLRTAARYLPAAGDTGSEVGGDWYDTVALPGGRVAIVVGDVMGRGLSAAALMGQVRAGLRAYAVRDLPPGDVLTSADELVRGLAEDSLVTCVYAVYDPRQERLVLANAGHVPPLLLGGPGGGQQVVELPATGPPLGAGGREPYGERVVDLRADQMLVLYTDGLVETRHDALDTGIDRLAAALHPVPDDLEAACSAVTGLLAQGSQDDDVAVLLVRPDPATRPAATRLQLEAGPRAAGRARALTAGTLAEWGEPGRTLEVAELAVSELVTNAVRHAGTPVDLQLSRHEESVVIEVSDDADGVPRWRRAAPDEEGGRGLMLVAELADAWGSRSRPEGGKTVWCRIDRRPTRR